MGRHPTEADAISPLVRRATHTESFSQPLPVVKSGSGRCCLETRLSLPPESLRPSKLLYKTGNSDSEDQKVELGGQRELRGLGSGALWGDTVRD